MINNANLTEKVGMTACRTSFLKPRGVKGRVTLKLWPLSADPLLKGLLGAKGPGLASHLSDATLLFRMYYA